MQMAIANAFQISVEHVLISLSSVKVLSGSETPAGLGAASACEDICCFLPQFSGCV